ncbi:MAG: tetratricopeptide repeat protein [Candidatus Omnitrophota bacterium]
MLINRDRHYFSVQKSSVCPYLLAARIRLDNAITYGSKREARALAAKFLKEAIKKAMPGEVEYFKGQVEMLKGNLVTAIEHFDAAVKHNPKDGAAYNDRGLCMVDLGIIDEAFVYFDKGIEVEPDYATIYHNKGWLLNNIGRHSEAIVYFKKALSLQPGRAVTYDNLADAYFNLYDYAAALEAYKQVLKLLKPRSCPGISKQIKERIRLIAEKIKNAHKDN